MKMVGVVGPMDQKIGMKVPNKGTADGRSGSVTKSKFEVAQKHKTDMMKKPLMHKSLKGTGCC